MEPWAQLVSTTDIESEPILISTQNFIIGRAQGVDLCLANNKFVSGHHCAIEREPHGNIWLRDSSTNGTLLNEKTKVCGQKVELHHGDEIFVVYKKATSASNVSFLFQILEELEREQLETTDEASSELDHTQPYEEEALTLPSADGEVANSQRIEKRSLDRQSHSYSSDEEPVTKKAKLIVENNAGENSVDDTAKCSKLERKITKQTTELKEKKSADSETNLKATVTMPPIIPDSSSDKKVGNQADTELEVSKQSCDAKLEKIPSAVASGSNVPGKSEGLLSSMEDELICTICYELLHNCVSLQPCLHTFCAGCYSEWMDKSKKCPSCRRKVKLISKNHRTNNIVEAFLKANPDKRRCEEELKELDGKNKIIKEMMEPPEPNNPIDYGSDEEENDDEEDEEDADRGAAAAADQRLLDPVPPFWLRPQPFPNLGYSFHLNVVRPPKTVCRQCPEYQGPNPAHNATPLGGPVASTSNNASSSGLGDQGGASVAAAAPVTKTFPVPPQFTCSANQNHILCQCCYQPMPHRSEERNQHFNPNAIPAQHCILCSKAFCHAYWGCHAACNGCLNKFEDTVFRPEVYGSIILKNTFESHVLKNYLEERGIPIHDFFKSCVEKLKAGVYTCAGQNMLLLPDSAVCYVCALDRFSQIAYQFRRDIHNEMPDAVKNRPNCYWGRSCRTQWNNERHAQTYNHICEASRTDVRF